MELTSLCHSVAGTNKNETSFGLEMSQTGFSSHVVEVPAESPASVSQGMHFPFLALWICHPPSQMGWLFLLSLFLRVSLPPIFCGLEEGSRGLPPIYIVLSPL